MGPCGGIQHTCWETMPDGGDYFPSNSSAPQAVRQGMHPAHGAHPVTRQLWRPTPSTGRPLCRAHTHQANNNTRAKPQRDREHNTTHERTSDGRARLAKLMAGERALNAAGAQTHTTTDAIRTHTAAHTTPTHSTHIHMQRRPSRKCCRAAHPTERSTTRCQKATAASQTPPLRP